MPQLFSNPVLKCFKSWKRGCLFAAFPCLIALVWFFHHTIYAKAGHPGMVYLPPHASARTLSEILHQRGLLKHPGVLRLYLRIWHLAGHLKPGYYAYTADENLSQLVQKMVTGKVYTVPLTIIEGSRLCELETIWSNSKTYRYQASLLNDFKPVHGSLEGLFFPSTYPQAYREIVLSNIGTSS